MSTPVEDELDAVIADWRGRIDALDDRLLALLAIRRDCSLVLQRFKADAALPCRDPAREAEIKARLAHRAGELGFPADATAQLLDALFELMR